MRKGILLMAVLVAVTACATTDDSGAPDVDFTVEYECGFGFYAGNSDQTSGLLITYGDFDGAWAGRVARTGELEAAWDAQLQTGTDLFANWCDDVIEEGEPTPEVETSWSVTGRIEVTELPGPQECGPATAELTDLVARGPVDQVVELGDMTITNTAWGCFAG